MTSALEQFHVQCGALKRRLKWIKDKVKQEKPISGDKHHPPSPVPLQQNERCSWTPTGYNFKDLPTSDLLWSERKALPPIPCDSLRSSSMLLASKECSRTDAGSPDHIYEEIPFFTDDAKTYDSNSVTQTTRATLSCYRNTCENHIRSDELNQTPRYLPPRIMAEHPPPPPPTKEMDPLKPSGGTFELDSQLRTSDSKLIPATAEIQVMRNIDATIFRMNVQSNDGADSPTSTRCNQNYGERQWMTSQNVIRKSPQCSKVIGPRVTPDKFSCNNYDAISTEIEQENIKTPINNNVIIDKNNSAFENINDVIIGKKRDVSIRNKGDEACGQAKDAVIISKIDIRLSNIGDDAIRNRCDVIGCRGFDFDKSPRQDDEDIKFGNEVKQILVDLDASLDRTAVHLFGQRVEHDSQCKWSSDNYNIDHGTRSAPNSALQETASSPKRKYLYFKRRGITGESCFLSANSRGISEELGNHDLINPQENLRINTNFSVSQGYCNHKPTLKPISAERLPCSLKSSYPLQTAILDISRSHLAVDLLKAKGCEWTVSSDRIIGHNRLLEVLIQKNFDRQTFLI